MSEWTEWNGGDCPAPGDMVDIRMRSGRVVEKTRAVNWLWGRPKREAGTRFVPAANDNGGEIVAYRKIGEVA